MHGRNPTYPTAAPINQKEIRELIMGNVAKPHIHISATPRPLPCLGHVSVEQAKLSVLVQHWISVWTHFGENRLRSVRGRQSSPTVMTEWTQAILAKSG